MEFASNSIDEAREHFTRVFHSPIGVEVEYRSRCRCDQLAPQKMEQGLHCHSRVALDIFRTKALQQWTTTTHKSRYRMCFSVPTSMTLQINDLISLEWIMTTDSLFSFLHDFNSDSAKRTTVEVLPTMFNHILGISSCHCPLVLFVSPWAVPVETANFLVGGRVDEIKRACGPCPGVRFSACVDLHFIVGSNGFPFIYTFIDLFVLVTYEIANISKRLLFVSILKMTYRQHVAFPS